MHIQKIKKEGLSEKEAQFEMSDIPQSNNKTRARKNSSENPDL